MEFELCKFLNCSPKHLGELRIKDPSGIAFIELSMIHRWNETAKQHDKAEKERDRKSKGRRH